MIMWPEKLYIWEKNINSIKMLERSFVILELILQTKKRK